MPELNLSNESIDRIVEATNKGFWKRLLNDFLPALALVVGAAWFLFSEIDKRATPADVEAKITAFELRLEQGHFAQIGDSLNKIEFRVEGIANKLGVLNTTAK